MVKALLLKEAMLLRQLIAVAKIKLHFVIKLIYLINTKKLQIVQKSLLFIVYCLLFIVYCLLFKKVQKVHCSMFKKVICYLVISMYFYLFLFLKKFTVYCPLLTVDC